MAQTNYKLYCNFYFQGFASIFSCTKGAYGLCCTLWSRDILLTQWSAHSTRPKLKFLKKSCDVCYFVTDDGQIGCHEQQQRKSDYIEANRRMLLRGLLLFGSDSEYVDVRINSLPVCCYRHTFPVGSFSVWGDMLKNVNFQLTGHIYYLFYQ